MIFARGTFTARYGLSVREGDAAAGPDFLDRLRAGDARAVEEFVATHQHRVFSMALRMLGAAAEAEEVAQEAFLRAHRSLGEFRGEARLSTWLYTIVSRLCLNRLASGDRRAVRHGEEILLRVADKGGGPAAQAERGELEEALHRAIAELAEERRVVIILRDLEGLSYEEMVSKPTPVWLLRNAKAAAQRVETSYLTGSISWKADYVMVINADDNKSDLTRWVTIDNKSGATCSDAALKLVAGDINGARDRRQEGRVMDMAARAASPPAAERDFKSEGFFEYHLHTLDGRTTIKDNQTNPTFTGPSSRSRAPAP